MGTLVNLKLQEPEGFTDQKNEELTRILEDSFKYDNVKIKLHEQEMA